MTQVLSHPFTVNTTTNSFDKVEYNSDLYKAQQISGFMRTEPGERPIFPSFGSSDPTFGEFSAESCAESFGSFYSTDDIRIQEISIIQVGGAIVEIQVTYD